MNAKHTFDKLRDMAREKRDSDIKQVRQEYKERLAQISVMEQELGIKRSSKPARKKRHAIRDAITLAIPQNEPFTFDEVAKNLSQAGVQASLEYIRVVIRRMVKRGELKEVANPSSRLTKMYALPNIEAESPPPPLLQALTEILGKSNAPMRSIEICVAMIESGQAMNCDPNEAVAAVSRLLQDNPDRFKEVDVGHWTSHKHRS